MSNGNAGEFILRKDRFSSSPKVKLQSIVEKPDLMILTYRTRFSVRYWDVPPIRSNPFWYCYWNETEGASVRFEDREIFLDPQHILLIPPLVPHTPVFHHPFIHNFVHFLAGAPFDRVHTPVCFPAEPYCRIFRQTEARPELRKTGAYTLIGSLLMQIPESAFEERKKTDPRISEALRILNSSLKTVSVAELAEHLAISESSLVHLFREQTGVSPHRYQLDRRLEAACILLHEDPSDIADIAEQTGFSDRYHFSKAFKRKYGVSPRAMNRLLTGN